jgi:methyl-accepting chemotaxis protein
MKIEEIERRMTEMTDVLTSTSTKLDRAADLNLLLGRKLDRFAENANESLGRLAGNIDRLAEKTHEDLGRLAQQIGNLAEHMNQGFGRLTEQSLKTDQKIDRLADKIDQVNEHGLKTDQKIDRLADKIDRLVDALASRNAH